MKSLESSHEYLEDTEQPLEVAAPQPLPRRTAAGTVPAATNTNAPPASSRFGAAVNSGIRALQYKGGNGLDGDRAHELAASGFAGGGGALPHADAVQRSFGKHDIGGVSAHVGGAASQAADALGATGYASGNSVAFAGAPDLRLAAHEAAHVVQQRGGVRLSGGVGASGDEYERHADEVADLVVSGKSAESTLDRYAHRGVAGGSAVQFQLTDPAHTPGGGTHGARDGGGTSRGTGGGGGGRSSRTGGGGGRGGRGGSGTPPAPHILQQPDVTTILAQVRAWIEQQARDRGLEFPTAMFNGLSHQLQTVIARGENRSLLEQPYTSSSMACDWVWSMGGSVTLGEPTDVRTQHGRGTTTDGSQDQTVSGSSSQITDGSTDTVGIEGTVGGTTPVGPPVADGPTVTGSVTPSGSHESTHSEQAGTTASDSHQHTEGSSMAAALEHTEFTRSVSVEIHGTIDVAPGLWGAAAQRFGLASAGAARLDMPSRQVGEVAGQQQGAEHARPSAGRPPPAPPAPRAQEVRPTRHEGD